MGAYERYSRKKSLFTQIDNAIDEKDYKKASKLQIEMSKKVNELAEIYKKYKKIYFSQKIL